MVGDIPCNICERTALYPILGCQCWVSVRLQRYLGCSYCYESGINSKKVMDEEKMADSIIRFAKIFSADSFIEDYCLKREAYIKELIIKHTEDQIKKK